MATVRPDARLVRAARAGHDAAKQMAVPPQAPETRLAPSRVPTQDLASPTALVSWAHRGEEWSDAEADAWTQQVVEFTGVLRANGVDADLDLFHAHEADIDWSRFGPAAVARSDFVIVAISEAWAERWAGTNAPHVGAGAVAEADALKGLFQRDQGKWQRKVMLVVLPSQDEATIPDDLMRATRFWVDPDDPDSSESLIRTLTGQPLYSKPSLGRVPVLPPAVAASLGMQGQRSHETASEEFADYSAVLSAVRRSGKLAAGDSANDRLALLRGLLGALSG